MTFKDSIDLHNRVAELDSFRLSDEDKEALHRSLSDPTGLKPFLEQQIEQNDQHTEQIEHLKSALQKQIEQNDTHTQQIEQLQAALQKQILDAVEERRLRETADKEEHEYTQTWYIRNFIVAIIAVLLALVSLFK